MLRGLLRDPSCGKSLSSAKLTSRDYYLPVLTLLSRFYNTGLILGRHIVSNLLILQGSCALLVSNLEFIDVYLRVPSHVVARLLYRLELYLLLRSLLLLLLFRDLRGSLQRVISRAS